MRHVQRGNDRAAHRGVTGLMTFAQLEDFDMLITEEAPSAEEQARVKASGTRLIVAEQN